MINSVREIVMQSAGIWIGLSDASCEVNSLAFWSATRPVGAISKAVRTLEEAEEVVSWQVVLDGCFRLRIVLGSDAQLESPSQADLCKLRFLSLPSGGLVARSAALVGDPVMAMQVAPGRYRVRVEWFVDEESKHYDILEPSGYPVEEGPDGIITLVPSPLRVHGEGT